MNAKSPHGVDPFESIPFLGEFQSRFNTRNALNWLSVSYHIPVIASVIYVALVFYGQKWMKNRPSYDLKKALFLWNVALAVFSILGTISILPSLAATTYHFGFGYSVCKSHGVYTPHVGVWGFAFVISKIVEFGDTFFLVVRKRPIMFLHWYHHITVLMFSWYCLGQGVIGMGHWFSTVNYFVHSLMYTYYSIAAGGIRLPSGIAKAVTIIQLLQMVVGIIVNITICLYKDIYDFCEFDVKVLWFGVAIYSSYALLFGHYFYQRYIKRN